MGTEMSEQTRVGRVLAHFRHNVVGYLALFIAVSMTPIPSYAHGLIGTAQLKNGAVTTAKLAPNAVKSGKIANGQVKKLDIAAGARGYTSIKTVKASVSGIGVGSSATINVPCGAGRVAIGGGGYVLPTGIIIIIGGTAGEVTRSHPINQVLFAGQLRWSPSADAATATGWRVVVKNTTDEERTAYGYAICASK